MFVPVFKMSKFNLVYEAKRSNVWGGEGEQPLKPWQIHTVCMNLSKFGRNITIDYSLVISCLASVKCARACLYLMLIFSVII